ncbi:sulfite exporter TauE/SafE family protein [Bradyrhizobium elkanii]|nr:sulfite exporter TauE/SafE family protein [Bradyrhizobium elkanii]
MPEFDGAMLFLAATTCFAAFVNGAIGYGFSSLTVPLALVFYPNRILNPAIVIIEVFVNVYVLFINLKGVPAVWRRVFPILLGLLPGIALGGYALASLQPGWIKFATYTIILPLILLQAAGWRRPIEASWLIGLPFGSMLGILYSVTTISGPPLAMLFNNQGLVKKRISRRSCPGSRSGIERNCLCLLQARPFHFRKRQPALCLYTQCFARHPAGILRHSAA